MALGVLSKLARSQARRQNAAAAGERLRRTTQGVETATGRATESAAAVSSLNTQMRESLSAAAKVGEKATVGHHMMLAGGAAFGTMGASAFISGIQEKFGDQMSGAANFGLSATKIGVMGIGGIRTLTHLGRAGIAAHAKFGSGPLGTAASLEGKLATSRRAAGATRRDLSRSQKVLGRERGRFHRAGRTADDQMSRVLGGPGGGKNIRSEREIVTEARDIVGPAVANRRAVFRENSQRLGQQISPAGRQSASAPAGPVRDMRAAARRERLARRHIKRVRETNQQNIKIYGQSGTVSARGNKALKDVAKVRNEAADTLRTAAHKRTELKNLDIYNKTQKFSASSLAFGVAKMPFAMGGAMLGKGSGLFGGAIDPGMSFIGKAMGAGSIGGLAAGAGVGITAMKTGNLGRTEGAMQRQQGRSFSNISYNATLHAHRLNN